MEFHIDGEHIQTIDQTVPTRAGRLWLGAWFPQGWAGEPDFDIAALEIDWVRITAFEESSDEFVEESYPDDGWAN